MTSTSLWKLLSLSLIGLNCLGIGLGVLAIGTETGRDKVMQILPEEAARGCRFVPGQRPLLYARCGLDGEFSWFRHDCYMVRTDQIEPVIAIMGPLANEWTDYKFIRAAIRKSGAQFGLTQVNRTFCLSNLPPLYVTGDTKGAEVPTYDPDAWQNLGLWTQNGTVKPGTACQHPENQVRAGGWHLTINSLGIAGAAACSPVEPPVGSGS